jgi:hypothetical protein
MQLTHWMECERALGGAVVFTCPEEGCGRRVVASASEGFRVIDQGDFFAKHVGAAGRIVTSAEVGQ